MSEDKSSDVEELLKEILTPEEFQLLQKIIKNKGEVEQKDV